MSISLLISAAGKTVLEYMGRGSEKLLEPIVIRSIPPFSITYQIYSGLAPAITSIFGLILLGGLLNYSIERYWNSLYKPPTTIAITTPITEQEIELTKPWIHGWVYRDLKIIIRNPRFLASAIYLLIFPILMPLLIGLTTPALKLRWIAPIFNLTIGSFSGVVVSNLFIMEGEGAKILYTLPVSRREYILGKSLTVLYLATFTSIAIATYAYLILKVDPLLTPLLCIIYILSAYSSSLFIALIYMDFIPKQPSAWTQYTFTGLGISLRILGVIIVYIILGGILSTPMLLETLSEAGLINIQIPKYLTNILAIYIETIITLIFLTSIGILSVRKRNEPL